MEPRRGHLIPLELELPVLVSFLGVGARIDLGYIRQFMLLTTKLSL